MLPPQVEQERWDQRQQEEHGRRPEERRAHRGVCREELADGRFLLGSPEVVAEQIIDYNKRLGVNLIILGIQWVGMPHQQVIDSLRLFAAEVMPLVKEAT